MAEEIERLVELDLGYVPEAVGDAALIQTAGYTILAFSAVRVVVERRETAEHIIVTFPSCIITQFGDPADIVLQSHRFYSFGLRSYKIYEVLNSSWAKLIDQQHRVVFPNTKRRSPRHFIITFPHNTFECLAENIHLEVMDIPYIKVEF